MGAEITYINDETVPSLKRSEQVLEILKENLYLKFHLNGTNPVTYKSNYFDDGISVQIRDSKGTIIANFYLSELPGCSGILVSHGLYIVEECRGKGIAQILLKAKEYIAKEYGYSSMLATTVAENVSENHILAKFGWKADEGFVNSRTKRTVFTWRKTINK